MKLSPLSIPYRLLRVASGFVWVLIFAGFGSVSMFGMSVGTAVLAGLFGLGFLVLVGYQVRYYQRFEYRLTADSLDITSGSSPGRTGRFRSGASRTSIFTAT
ncbi:hypothetical protein ACFQH3_05880 [Haladaptatus sp. GCM10025707]|uniref:hypothetical protein n=1 Tax=unclassified Haladaptatus TaxID=2622732 RepID=UPI00360C7952